MVDDEEMPAIRPKPISSLQGMLDCGVDVSAVEKYGYLPPHRLVGLDMDSLDNVLETVGSRIGGKSRSGDPIASTSQKRHRCIVVV